MPITLAKFQGHYTVSHQISRKWCVHTAKGTTARVLTGIRKTYTVH